MSVDLPKTSRAMVVTEFDAPLVPFDLQVPTEIEPGALLVRTHVTTLCGSDVHIWDGSVRAMMPLQPPVVLGHEFVGEVVALGAGAERDSTGTPLAPGDRIVWTHESCGQCVQCVVFSQPSLCGSRRHYMTAQSPHDFPYLVGGLSEYIYVFPRSGRLRVPDALPSSWASASSCALRTVMQAFERLGPVEPWQSVVVQGSGPVGLFAAAVARRKGAGRVVVVGDPAVRLELAARWGADQTLSVSGLSVADRLAAVLDATGGGADVVVEASGGRGVVNEGIEMLKRGARYVIVGQVGGNEEKLMMSKITFKQASVLGSFSGHTSHYWQALRFMEETRHEFDFEAMFGSSYALEDATTALENMRSMEDIKAIIEFS